MAEERIEEHEHTTTETDDGTTETHTDKVVEKGTQEKKPEITSVTEETIIEDTD
ncbi:MAG TPA: hypothetical protein VKB86_16570 [Pyrinomonadaceae bacterium]|nr:hypothetical protein [Pyrinomonadaceae bacterium]